MSSPIPSHSLIYAFSLAPGMARDLGEIALAHQWEVRIQTSLEMMVRDVPSEQPRIVLWDVTACAEESWVHLERMSRMAPDTLWALTGSLVPVDAVVRVIRNGLGRFLLTSTTPVQLKSELEFAYLQHEFLMNLRREYEEFRSRFSMISEAELEVLNMIVDGVPNKTIATRVKVSQRTVEARRQRLHRKLKARTLADMIRTAYRFELLKQLFEKSERASPAHAWSVDSPHLLIREPNRTQLRLTETRGNHGRDSS